MEADTVPKSLAIADNARQRPSVIIIAQVRFLREALAEILGRDQTLSISGLFPAVNTALFVALEKNPDIVLFDAAFPNGADAVRQIRDVAPRTRVIVLAVEETENNIIAWAEAGVAGYIPSTAALADLNALLTDIMRGEQNCTARVAAGLLRRISTAAPPGAELSSARSMTRLTPRELQITELVAVGLSNKDISRRLNIGVATTKSHLHNLLGKLGLQRRGQIARWVGENKVEL